MLRERVKIDEHIIIEAKISKAAIIMDWLLFPFILLLFFVTVCIPVLYGIYSDVQKLQDVAEMLGVEDINFTDLVANMTAVFGLPKFVKIILGCMVGLLFLCWFIWACVKTRLHFGYGLIATDERILLSSKGEYLESEWEGVKNVFAEQSLWGKIFGYGNITVHTGRGVLTVKSVTSPIKVKNEFYFRIQDTAA